MDGTIIEQLRRLIVASAQGNKQAENLIIDSFLALTKRTVAAEKRANEANIEAIVNNILNKK